MEASPVVRGVLPAEHEATERVILVWNEEYAAFHSDVIRAVADDPAVTITLITDPWDSEDALRDILAERGADEPDLDLVPLDLDSIWIRDFGPLVTRTDDGSRVVVDLDYFRDEDDHIAAELAARWHLPVVRVDVEAEGGNILSDGHGRCIISDDVFAPHGGANDERAVRDAFRRYLGCDNLLVLPVLVGEDTGHVDMYVAVTGPGRALVGHYDRDRDPVNAYLLDDAAARLAEAGWKVARIPMPDNLDGHFRTYTNAVPVNGVVLVPVYPEDSRHEAAALEAFAAAFPERIVVPVEASELILLSGAVRCATMTVAGPR